jgi:hypothetical protein
MKHNVIMRNLLATNASFHISLYSFKWSLMHIIENVFHFQASI